MGALSLLFNAEALSHPSLVSSVIRPPRTSPGFAAGCLQNRRPWSFVHRNPVRLASILRPRVHPRPEEEESCVEELRIPESWWVPSRASEVLTRHDMSLTPEAEWLRVSLHKWLDDEYCPEETNIEISKVAAKAYYESLLEKRADLGEILLRMVTELETISYRDSFHGAFSSANAAVNLIVQRINPE